MPDEIILPPTREEIEEILETARQKIAKEFGVTLVEDHSGEFGPMGRRYLTIRFKLHGKLVQVETVIEKVS